MNVNQDKLTKISIISLVLLLCFLVIKFLKTSNDYKAEIQRSELEINLLENQLNEILDKYDSIHVESNVTKDLLFLNADIRPLNDNASQFNEPSTKSKKNKTAPLARRSNKKNGLKAININVKGVKIFSDNYNHENALIRQLRVCYTLSSDSFIKQGPKKIYLQAINPNDQIILTNFIDFDDGSETSLGYTAVSEVLFNNLEVDECVYLDLDDKITIKGDYVVNLYCDFVKIGTATFHYR